MAMFSSYVELREGSFPCKEMGWWSGNALINRRGWLNWVVWKGSNEVEDVYEIIHTHMIRIINTNIENIITWNHQTIPLHRHEIPQTVLVWPRHEWQGRTCLLHRIGCLGRDETSWDVVETCNWNLKQPWFLWNNLVTTTTHMVHVWYIYLHLGDL